MCALEQKQTQTMAFLDRHRQQKEKMFAVGNPVLVFQTKMVQCLENFDFDGQGHSGQ